MLLRVIVMGSILLQNVVCTCSPKKVEFSDAVQDQVLIGPRLGSVRVPSEYACQYECIENDHCSLFNYNLEGKCELLDDRSQDFALQTRPGWFTKAQKCEQNVCTNGGSCLSIGEESNTTCVCTLGWTGKNCGLRAVCPSRWHIYLNKCYKYILQPAKWSDAELNCAKLGGTLASITSEEENDFVWHNVISRAEVLVWIGGNDLAKEGVFVWTDGEPFDFTKWATGNPDNHKNIENCIQYGRSFGPLWNDNVCTKSLTYVCKKERLIKTKS